MQYTLQLVQGGIGNLAAYLAAHVLLCLLPAFFIAGAMAALIPKAGITRWLGRNTRYRVSYPAAAAAGSLLAVCSCTIVPLFAGIYRKGAGLGPAIIGIGLLMALLFWRDDAAHDARTDALFAGQTRMGSAAVGLLLSLIALLLAGTLKLAPLNAAIGSLTLPLSWAESWQATLAAWVPFDPAKGEEGVSVQGSVLIVLLAGIGVAAWQGLEDIVEGFNRWTPIALGLAGATLLVGALRLTAAHGSLEIVLTGRAVAVAAAIGAVAIFARRLDADELRAWLWESWRFVKQIFVLLLAGVFAVGVIRQLIQPEWIQAIAGANTVLANASAVIFGVFMYFPTLVEVPVARMFLDLGMHPGPLLAYLMADPELSLQSMLMVAAVIGRGKTAAYVGLVAVFSIVAGLLYGAWVDRVSIVWIVLGLAAFVLALVGALAWLNGRRPPLVHST